MLTRRFLRNARFSRAFLLSDGSVEMPTRLPLSTSALLLQSFSLCAQQPIVAAIQTDG